MIAASVPGMTGPDSTYQGALSLDRIGALPDAPLAMPKQRLEPMAAAGSGMASALLRALFARTGRSRG